VLGLLTPGLKGRVQSQWKAFKKGGVEDNKACWSCAKYYLGSTSASPAGTLYPGVTYTAIGDERGISNAEEFEELNMGLSAGDTSKLSANEGLFTDGV
jgi:hypothetical protein